MQLDERIYLAPSGPKITPGLEAAREQIDRLLASNTFHASDVLRRLLKFLADKTFSGDADELKEYSVGLDALGKPPTYDPRQDAAVRLQASRLRQKLDDYYRNEGRSDSLIIELPKGRFKIAWHYKSSGDSVPVAVVPSPPVVVPLGIAAHAVESNNPKNWSGLTIGLAVISVSLGLLSVWALSRPPRTVVVNSPAVASTAELDALWSPFLSSAHHLIIGFSNPLFVALQRSGKPDIVYRTRGTVGWDDAIKGPEFSALTRSLGNPSARPTFNLVERSNLVSTFVLTQFLARRRGDISLARSAELSWQQFADNDVILFSSRKLFEGQSALPVQPLLIVEKGGIRNLQPRAGEPPVYVDLPDHQESDGEALELVSMMPGPMGRTTVVTFSSNHAWGLIGGVQSLTDPAFARVLLEKLKDASGKIPPYYQVVFKVKYRNGTPTNASYVTHRTLTLTQKSDDARETN